MPLVWTLRLLGKKDQTRVYGPTLTLSLVAACEEQNLPVGFYGGASDILSGLSENLKQKFPRLKVNYLFSPPFRELTEEEDAQIVKAINDSGARVLFIGLGCPKQEYWMIAHREKIHAVMLGVGAAFDFIAGKKSQAPSWMQRVGLEWLYRLLQEPRRLGRRYLYHNPRFVFLILRQLIFKR
jgi:N-acetylglucosaminyldiphosphoundecaprenol N-acetyl-beta-D-mannosaminyltransferase